MTSTYIITLLCIGITAGILSGLVGVGGGIILVPALVFFFNFSQHQAQGTSLGVLSLPVVIFAFLSYYQSLKSTDNAISFAVIGILAIGFIVGALAGGQIAQKVNQEILKKIFGILLLYIAFKMLSIDNYILNLFKK